MSEKDIMKDSRGISTFPAGGGLEAGQDRPGQTWANRTRGSWLVVIAASVGSLLLGAFLYFGGHHDLSNHSSQKQTAGQGEVTPTQSVGPQGTPMAAPPAPPAGRPEGDLTPPSQLDSAEAAPSRSFDEIAPRAVATTRIRRPNEQSADMPSERQDDDPAVRSMQPMTNRATALPSDEVLIIERSRANVRSEPSRNGRVIAKIAKGTQVKVIRRSRNWIEVETGAYRGWISSSLLEPAASR
jgi:Bacterial SH3 domain.